MQQNQNHIKVDLEKHNITFPKEGILLGIDIIGYLDKDGKLIEGSISHCSRNIYIKQTDKSEIIQTFFKDFNTDSWTPASSFPKPQTNEFTTVNAMFGAEVIFEEY